MSSIPIVLTPIEACGFSLTNRAAVAPLTRISTADDGVPTDNMARYYAHYARGGWGMIFTEGTYTDLAFSQGYLGQPGCVSPAQQEGWAKVLAAVRAADPTVKVVMQIMHAGALTQGNVYRDHTIGPSAVPLPGEQLVFYRGQGPYPTPREATLDDLAAAKQGFVDTAVKAKEVGFDGVEVHGANGYLLDQFITEYLNQRQDQYGGDITQRMTYPVEVIAAVRAAVGPDFPVGVRLSQTKVNDPTYRWPGKADEARIIFGAVKDAGVAWVHLASQGTDWFEAADMGGGLTLNAIAKQTGLDVVANGGMHEPAQAEQVLSGGHGDVVTLGRGAIANPDWPKRLAMGAAMADFDFDWMQPEATIENAESVRASKDQSQTWLAA